MGPRCVSAVPWGRSMVSLDPFVSPFSFLSPLWSISQKFANHIPTPPQLQQPPWSVQTPPSARIQTLNSPLCARRHPSLNPPAQHSTLQTGRLLDMGQPVQVRGGVIIEPSINHHSSKWYRTGWKRPMLGVCRHSLASTFYLLNMLERFMLR
jgi:hypothetical protein